MHEPAENIKTQTIKSTRIDVTNPEERQKLHNDLEVMKMELARVQGELKNCKKILQLEVGSEEDVANALKSPGNWKGRAERIAQLEQKLAFGRIGSGPSSNVVIDKKRTSELEVQVKDLEEKVSGLTRVKLALKSRNDALEASIKELRNDVCMLIDREKTSSRLIDCLREFLL
jgi:SMC interacting uncharacterized protein involved in chromosome segregation